MTPEIKEVIPTQETIEKTVDKPPDKLPEKEKKSQDKAPKVIKPTSVYPTDFYQAIGIPVCGLCGSKKQTNESGVICPENNPNCPYVNQ